ncbi:MAG: hypothetical protein HWN81_06985, partial [Candidatus Lokiarchaeota archaeon]|nr:hypothetical protein [Candidatus Lokiarchaeota archaeon]
MNFNSIVEEEPIIPSAFDLSSDADSPDNEGNFNLFWTKSDGAVNYFVYQDSSYINEINVNLTILEEGIRNLTIFLSDYG